MIDPIYFSVFWLLALAFNYWLFLKRRQKMEIDEKSGYVVKGVSLRRHFFDFSVISKIFMFVLGVFVGAGFFILLGEIFLADPLYLDSPTLLYEKVKDFDGQAAVWIFTVSILIPVLLNVFALMFRVAPVLLTRFELRVNKKRLEMRKRFNAEVVVLIDFSRPFYYERCRDYLGARPFFRTPVAVHVFSQGEKAIAITRDLKGDSSLKKSPVYVMAGKTAEKTKHFYQLFVENWFEEDLDAFILAAKKKAKTIR